MDFTQPIEIAKNIYWVGKYLENDPFQCHPYFIENGDESVLIDPGSMLEFDMVVKKINTISSMQSVKYIILHHQDPDLAAAVPEFEKLINRDDLLVVTHSRMVPLVKHYMIMSDYYEIDKRAFKLHAGELQLQFLTTPYCHSPGAFVSYEPVTKTLFSGDIFGGIEESWEFYAQDDYFDKAKQFHAEYMPSKDIFNYALSKIETLDLELIAPQHGSVIQKEQIAPLIRQMKALECGLYIEEGYHEQLIDTIDALKRKDSALLESLSHFQILMDTMHEAVIVSAEDNTIIDLNAATEHIFTATKPEFMKRKLLDIVSKHGLKPFEQALLMDQFDPFEVTLTRQDGEEFPALVGGRKSHRDNLPVRITTVIDLSELKEKESLLFQKAKMADMGEMIGNIAHQWRQPLSMITMIIAVLKEKSARRVLKDEELGAKLGEVETSIQYMSGTMDDFMSFYRPNKTKEDFCISHAVERAIEILNPGLRENCIALAFAPRCDFYVHGYMNEYTQVLVSMLTNAKDLLIHRKVKLAYIKIKISEKNGRVILEIMDNAGGMKGKNLDRVFEPYFTTKHKSSGTGLGLYISKMIIENSMNGTLRAENMDEGAKFTIEMERVVPNE
ncbi:MAG: ATP-binding protein [Helicobacteraceae bacterium]|jgi:PAS domain S-box-containing protein|nr:ATP-binding protein [Helicobacteraceae bacterium]